MDSPQGWKVAVEGALEGGQVELLHREHGLREARDLLGAAASHHLVEGLGDDLPGDAEAVLAPAAPFRLGYGGEALPVAIDLRLVAAVDHQGDGLVEGEAVRVSAVHGHEPGLAEAEIGEHHGPLPVVLHAGRVADELARLRSGEDRAVELAGLLRLSVGGVGEEERRTRDGG